MQIELPRERYHKILLVIIVWAALPLYPMLGSEGDITYSRILHDQNFKYNKELYLGSCIYTFKA